MLKAKTKTRMYSSPRLTVYGNIRDLAQQGAMGKANDGMNNKTV